MVFLEKKSVFWYLKNIFVLVLLSCIWFCLTWTRQNSLFGLFMRSICLLRSLGWTLFFFLCFIIFFTFFSSFSRSVLLLSLVLFSLCLRHCPRLRFRLRLRPRIHCLEKTRGSGNQEDGEDKWSESAAIGMRRWRGIW